MAKPLDEWIASDMHHVQRRSLSRLSERCSFRDPVRPIHADASYFFSPTDGVILYQRTLGATDTLLEIKGRTYSLREALRDSTFDARCLVIGIFMTLYDAPVNRVPIAGILDFRLLPPIDDCNHPTLAVEESLLHGGKAAMGEAEYLFSNQRMLNRIYAPTLGLTYYLLQIADYDVSAILPFDQDQQRHYAQGDRFSEIRYGSQVDLIIPVSRRWRFETLLPDSTHVEAGLDPLVCITPIAGRCKKPAVPHLSTGPSTSEVVSAPGRGGDSAWHRVCRGGAVGGGHRTCRLRWSCETSTLVERGSDDRG